MLAPLTKLMSINRKFKWTEVEHYAFDKIKQITAHNNLWTYPYFNESFKIHTDGSAFQLGAVISQVGKPIAFYSRKLTNDQQRYTLTEGEIISIIETLKDFRTILLGQKLWIHTDHKKITCNFFNTGIVLRWRLIIEEYGPGI